MPGAPGREKRTGQTDGRRQDPLRPPSVQEQMMKMLISQRKETQGAMQHLKQDVLDQITRKGHTRDPNPFFLGLKVSFPFMNSITPDDSSRCSGQRQPTHAEKSPGDPTLSEVGERSGHGRRTGGDGR